MTKEILLSICIPTFNRGELAHALVTECLQIKSDAIEIIISDNHSTDDTEKLLSAISDPRFLYHRNDENVGWDNMGRVLMLAHGKFCLLLRDKDSIPNMAVWFENIRPLLEQIDENKMFRGNVFRPNGIIDVTVPQQVFQRNTPDNFISIINMHTYSTSIIFPHKILSLVYDDAKNSAPYYWSVYPHVSLMLSCAKYCDFLPLPILNVQQRETKVFADVKGWNGTSDEPYWTVTSRKKQYLDLVHLIKVLDLPREILIPVLFALINKMFGWFMSAFGVIHSDTVQKRLDIVERDRKRPTTYWHFMFWDFYASITSEINKQFGFSIIDMNSIGIAFNYYSQLLQLTTMKDEGQFNRLSIKKGMRVLLTGVTGFIGSRLALRLVSDGCEVHALVRPTSRLEQLPAELRRSVQFHVYDSTNSIRQIVKAVHRGRLKLFTISRHFMSRTPVMTMSAA